MNSKIETYFNKVATTYLKKSHSGLWRILRNKELSVVLSFAGPIKDATILDLGSGGGFYANHFSLQNPKKITCVDLSEKMLREIKTKNTEIIKSDAQNYLSEDLFDIVFCLGIMEFISYPGKVFYNVSKMLKPNGKLIILFPNRSICSLAYRVFHRIHGIKIKCYSALEMDMLASSNGGAAIL